MSNIFHKIGDWWDWHGQQFSLSVAFLVGLGIYLFSYTTRGPDGFLISLFGLSIMMYPIFVLLLGAYIRRHLARIRDRETEAAE